MEKEGRIGLLQQFWIACSKPSLYKRLLDNKPSKRWLYLLMLVIAMTCIEFVIPFAAWDVSVGGLQGLIEERIPAFTMSKDGLTIDSPVTIDNEGSIRILADSDTAQYDTDDLKDSYYAEILMSRNNILVKQGEVQQEYDYSFLGDLTVDNASLSEMIPIFRGFLVLYGLFMAAQKAIQYLFWTLCYTLICRSAVRSPKGEMVTANEAFTLSFYAKTLLAVLSSVNVCLGYIVDSFIMTIISVIVTMTFICRAELCILKER